MNSRHILLIGPLPPPVGGDTISTRNLLNSRYWKGAGIELDHIDASGENRLRLSKERRSPQEVLRAMRIFTMMIWKIPRAKTVLLWANSSFICTFGFVVILLSYFMRRPILVKPFGSFLPEMIDRSGRIRKWIIVSILRRAQYILPQTDRLATELVERTGLDEDRIVRFPNFLPDTDFKSRRDDRPLSGKCLFVGQIKREKGVFQIIRALRGNQTFSCDFYGQLVERDTASFLNEMSSNENLNYRGILEQEEVIKTIGIHDILLFPTYHMGEGMPAVILQAFAAGVPVITTDWKSIPDIVRNLDTGILIPVGSSDALLESIALLVSDRRLYRGIADRASEYAKNYSEKAVVKKILIEKILGYA